MPSLSNEIKRLIVQRIALFVAVKDIQAELRDMGITVSASQVSYYDPGSANPDLAPKWKQLHDEIRAQFIKETANIAISHLAYRLSQSDQAYRKASDRGNLVLACAILEQAAKEVGGAFTNHRVLTGNDDGPIEVKHVVVGMYMPKNGREVTAGPVQLMLPPENLASTKSKSPQRRRALRN